MKKNCLLWLLCLVCNVHAKVALPAYFTDNMVLQQKTNITFHGKGKPGKKLKLITGWDNKAYSKQIEKDGLWSLSVATPTAGGPYTLTFSDGDKLQLQNVMIGEVWFCSGQSNMEMPIAGWGKIMNYEQEITDSNYPSIRLFQIKKNTSLSPLNDVVSTMGEWKQCSPISVPDFSSVAYFYARSLWKELNVPIGVIDCTWGGTPAEAWTSYETIKDVLGYQDKTAKMKELNFDSTRIQQAYKDDYREWQSLLYKKDKGMCEEKPNWASYSLSEEGWKDMSLPGYWEGKGLKDFDGVVWFRKTLDIPAEWAGKSLKLALGMIDDEDITYFDGTEIARGSGFMTPRVYTVPAVLVKEGKRVITVRVSDFGGEGGIHGEDKDFYIESEGKQMSLSGDWKYNVGLSLKGFPTPPLAPTSAGYPTVLFNAMVNPMVGFPIKGIIWYQGEANVGRAAEYGDLFPSMIVDWRRKWNNDFPFYFVQLANFMESKKVQSESAWAALREAQAKALRLNHTGMAVTIDIGLADNIHPKNKQEVGRRLALIALANTYGKNVSFSAPVFESFVIKREHVLLDFQNTGKGFLAKNSVLTGFTIAGADHVFYPATAVIEGDKIEVYAPQVNAPLAARYGWADNPECNLYGENGLPVAPFRTDNW